MIEFFAFSKKKGLRHYVDAALLSDFLKDEEETIWVDFEAPTEAENQLLSAVFNFHPLAIEDCIAESHLPKLDDYGDYLFLVVHAARRGDAPGTFTTVDVNFFVGKRYLITYHREHHRSIDQTKVRCQNNIFPLSKGVDFLLYGAIDALVDHYFPILDHFDVVIDELEQEAFNNPSRSTLDRIFSLKRDVATLRRITGPQREIIIRLSRDPFAVVGRRTAPYFRDVHDHLIRISDSAETFKELSAGLMEAYLMVVNNRLNEVIKVLTLLATIMLPLTVITGVYGMNFEHMPELRWRYGYFGVLGLMGFVVFGLLFFFRKRRWI